MPISRAAISGCRSGRSSRCPGARFELDSRSGRYRIAKIYAGENEEERYRSPLTEVGVDVHVGDYVLAINGRELEPVPTPTSCCWRRPNQPVEWRVSADAGRQTARTIRYLPIASETDLRYLEWVSANRSRVDRLSRIASAISTFPTWGMRASANSSNGGSPRCARKRLVVDERDNGGGNISEMLIERLARTLHGMDFSRNHDAAGHLSRAWFSPARRSR